jgi:hypothetical protein
MTAEEVAMSFFKLVPDEQMTPEAKQYIELSRKRLRVDRLGATATPCGLSVSGLVQAFAGSSPSPTGSVPASSSFPC